MTNIETIASMPMATGFMNVCIEPMEMWAGSFSIKFSGLNAAVQWYLRDQMRDVEIEIAESTAGLVRYDVILNGVGRLGQVCIRELPAERLTALYITAPSAPRRTSWTPEDKRLLESQPDRESRLRVARELGRKTADERDNILKWQSFVFNRFLERLLSAPEVVEALNTANGHFENFANYVKSEQRMSFWRRDKSTEKHKWIPQPERHAKNLLLTFLSGRFGNSVYTFDEIRSGAGRIDIFVISPAGEKIVVELKMCGRGYSATYAQRGLEQLKHYMENKDAKTGYLIVFDSRQRSSLRGFECDARALDGLSITTIIADIRPSVLAKRAVRSNRASVRA